MQQLDSNAGVPATFDEDPLRVLNCRYYIRISVQYHGNSQIECGLAMKNVERDLKALNTSKNPLPKRRSIRLLPACFGGFIQYDSIIQLYSVIGNEKLKWGHRQGLPEPSLDCLSARARLVVMAALQRARVNRCLEPRGKLKAADRIIELPLRQSLKFKPTVQFKPGPFANVSFQDSGLFKMHISVSGPRRFSTKMLATKM